MKKTNKFKVKYQSSFDFLTWEQIVEASSAEEASELLSKKGKILSIQEILESD